MRVQEVEYVKARRIIKGDQRHPNSTRHKPFGKSGTCGCADHAAEYTTTEAFAKLRDKVCAATSGPRAPRTRQHYCLPNSELVEIFGVNIRTIVRWKDTRNQTEEAKLFRAARENERAMYEAARIYRAAHPEKDQKSSQESFNETTDYSRRRIDYSQMGTNGHCLKNIFAVIHWMECLCDVKIV